ncbi:hypothetical protein AYO45_06315 [Gammaproteobacteria bacterium SCGC AG-212-F23]|nr:hypothetical protein AYO45_06315 [Gammaproteobacteria bacterium SCGC AG-212-F23]
MNDHVQQNLKIIQARIREYEIKYQRVPGSVALLAVSKNQSLEKIQQAIIAGQKSFGENYLQEAIPKIQFFAKENLQWHFIGLIQRNKTRKIAEYFSWAHTVTEKIIAQRLNDQRPQNLPALNICIQVNISQDPAKGGIKLNEVLPLVEFCVSLPRVRLRGLMVLPTQNSLSNEQATVFSALKILYEDLNRKGFFLDTLSMGMSDDLETAIAEGSTLVRIGTGIFGSR